MKEFKFLDRILVLTLSLLLIVGSMPTTLFAATEKSESNYTIHVVNENGEGINQADIEYEIFINDTLEYSGKATADKGSAVIDKISEYENEISSKAIVLTYKVSCDGYQTQAGKFEVTNAKESQEIKLQKEDATTAKVTINKKGNGEVKINDTEVFETDVEINTPLSLHIIPNQDPNGFTYIKSLKINSEEITVEKYQSYLNEGFQVKKDTVIDVEFSIEYEVKVTSNKGGMVTFNNQSKEVQRMETGSKADLAVEPEEGYQIGKIEINNEVQELGNSQTFKKELTIDKNTEIKVVFVKLYTIEVVYDSQNGKVEMDPACKGGNVVSVVEGKTVKILATPNANYRVSSVKKNDKITTYDKNDYIFEETISNVDKDWRYEISFALNIFEITADKTEHGKVIIDKSEVIYGEDSLLKITPEYGYILQNIMVNGKASEPERLDEDTYTLKLHDVKENQNVIVTFIKMPKADMKEVSFNTSDALRSTDQLYVFHKDQTVVFSTEKDGIRINGVNTGSAHKTKKSIIQKSTIIHSLEVFYKGENDNRADWHSIELGKDGIQIVIDQTEPKVELNVDQPNKNGYYHESVNVEIIANDPDDYSGIEMIEYWVTSDEKETQHEILKKDNVANSKDVITVDATLNNSDDVKVKVQVKDQAGNITNREEHLKINIDQPRVQIEVDGTLHPDAQSGCYNGKRTAKITIEDRASTFDAEAATKGIVIKKNGEAITNKNAMVSPWQTSGNIHSAMITFTDDGKYTWEFSYCNLADVKNEEITVTGDSVYEFTIDTVAPTGFIKMEDSIWDKVIETLTFGLWKNTEMSATVTGSDITTSVNDISYYKSNASTSLSETELDTYYQNGKFQKEPFTIKEDEHFTIYARLRDEAGNYSYISTNGAIVDMTASSISLKPEKANAFGFYNKDVKVGINVKDDDGTRSYSGIKQVTYRVENLGKVTQEGELYSFTEKNPMLNQLKAEFNGEIVVDSSKNNSDDVKVIVTTMDNAGNQNEEIITLAINIDAPKIDVTFTDKANRVEGERGYFPLERVATITIYDRASTFYEKNAVEGIQIEAKDHQNKKVDIDLSEMISEWKHEGDKHTATIRFTKDANYSWNINYENKAGVQVKNPVNFNGSTPKAFTVDKTEPFGTLVVGEDTNTLFRILQFLTFGAFSNDSISVSATADDTTSPVIVEYYKTDQATPIDAEALDKKVFQKFEPFQIDQDEQFFIYLKITDYAGNYIYINSDGYVLDKKESELSYDLEGLNANNIANGDVKVNLHVTDPAPYAGIHSIEYWVEKDGEETQRETLFEFDIEHPTQTQLEHDMKRDFIVNSKLNNSCNVIAYVKVIDNAGNEMLEEIPLDIDIVAPTIEVSYDNNTDHNGNSYFNHNRTATVTIIERSHHFDAQEATKGITIQALDAKGNKINLDLDTMISDWQTKEGKNPDEAVHTVTIAYTTDANYTFKINYTDKASLKNQTIDVKDAQAPFVFTVDKQAPTGTVTGTSAEGRVTTWDTLIDQLTFGFWSGQKITLTQSSNDSISPIESVSYYKTNKTKAFNIKELEKVDSWNDFKTFDVVANEQFTVYVRIIDYAGNTTYISSDGMIVDDTAPREEAIAPEITIQPEQPIHGFYNRDVAVSITVDDPLVGETYSGLKKVQYKVFNMGKVTQSGTLYTFDKEHPTQGELQKNWTGSILVDAEKNNSNDVVIEVSAQDNALNSSRDKTAIKIDVTKPDIEIQYDNNKADADKYYQEDRVAQITIRERNFNADDVKIKITNTDGSVPKVSDWIEQAGTGNQDNTTHTASIRYHDDGDYTFAITYTDLADNTCEKEQYVEGTTNPTSFTMDQTAPEISVSYNNNQVFNGKYFAANRVATMVVKEHNFNRERVNFSITSTLDGASIVSPKITWSDSGDIHTAVISYATDGDYRFDVKMLDLAGNVNHDVKYGNNASPKEFTIDTNIKEPTITGVENGHSYKDDVIPVISFSDTNYDSHEIKLTRTKMNEVGMDVTSDFISGITVEGQGGNGSYDTFKKLQENDGIYTLYVKVVDKAGNNIDKSVTFTVNRYGSVYEFDKYLISLIQKGGAYVQHIDSDLVITEYNADPLLEGSLSIEITKDGKPISDVAMQVSPAINTQVTVGESGWYQYQYTINKNNFNDDGVYKMSIASKDAAGNDSESMDYKDKEILFRVDHTTPEITSITGLEKSIVNAQELNVQYELYDTIGLKSVKVYVDDEQIDATNDFLNDKNHYHGKFTIKEKSSSQKVRLIVEDLAGNITDTNAEDFTSAYQFEHSITVSTNMIVRWYANKPLFYSSIVGVAGLGAFICYLVLKKKKKVEEKS